MSWLKKPFHHKKSSSPVSETYLLDQAMEKAQQEKRDLYGRNPELLVGEIQKIADDFPDIITYCGQSYFLAFVAGVLAERYGISIAIANQAVDAWNTK